MARILLILGLIAVLALLMRAIARDLAARRRRVRLERLRAAFVHGAPPLSPRPAAGVRTLRAEELHLPLPARWTVEQDAGGALVCREGLAAAGHLTIASGRTLEEPGWGGEEALDGGRTLARGLELSPDGARIVYAWRLRAADGRTYVVRLDVAEAGAGDILVLDDVVAIELGLRAARLEAAGPAVTPAAS
jgi:hypothetical protein